MLPWHENDCRAQMFLDNRHSNLTPTVSWRAAEAQFAMENFFFMGDSTLIWQMSTAFHSYVSYC